MTGRTQGQRERDWRQEDWRADLDARIQAAIAAGTHSATPPRVVCQGCGEYADGYLHRSAQDGKYFGRCYTPKSILDALDAVAKQRSRK